MLLFFSQTRLLVRKTQLLFSSMEWVLLPQSETIHRFILLNSRLSHTRTVRPYFMYPRFRIFCPPVSLSLSLSLSLCLSLSLPLALSVSLSLSLVP